MDLGRETPMAKPLPTAQDKATERLPMAHKPTPLSRRIQMGLAKIGLMTAVATGAAHHVDPNIGGPVGAIGTIPDAVGSTAVDLGVKTAEFAAKTGGDLVATVGDGIVKLADSEPQQEQSFLDQARKEAEALFSPKLASVDGQVQIPFTELSHAITVDNLAAIKAGQTYDSRELNDIATVDGLPAKPGSLVVIDNPEVVDIPGEGLGKFYTFSIGAEQVIIPNNFAQVTKPGNLVELSSIQDDSVLNTLNRVNVVNPTP